MQIIDSAYLLHTRHYRNTSVLADFFTLHHGRVNGVVRGVRGEKSKLRSIVQLFTPLEISWVGTEDLVTIRQIEPLAYLPSLKGEAIWYGFYANELLVRLLKVRDAHTDLYEAYATLLEELAIENYNESFLRLFEKRLLQSLGYGLQLTHEYGTGSEIIPEAWYSFLPDQGLRRLLVENQPPSHAFLGASLLAFHHEIFSENFILQDAKRLMRKAISRLLNDRPIKSRELFVS